MPTSRHWGWATLCRDHALALRRTQSHLFEGTRTYTRNRILTRRTRTRRRLHMGTHTPTLVTHLLAREHLRSSLHYTPRILWLRSACPRLGITLGL